MKNCPWSNRIKLAKLKTSGTNHDAYANALAIARNTSMKNKLIASIEHKYKEHEPSKDSKEVDRVSMLEDHSFTFPQRCTQQRTTQRKVQFIAHSTLEYF